MKRDFTYKGIDFHIGGYTPRGYFERGLKYKLFVGNIPTSYVFYTLREARNFAITNYFI